MTSLIEALKKATKDEDGRHTMSVMAPGKGDYKVTWDPEVAAEVEAARKSFNELKKKGMAAYAVDRKGDKGHVLNAFDPEEEAMIMAPALVGG